MSSGGHTTTLGAIWNMGRNAALSAADYVTPVLASSQFREKGVLTPEEFVAAGDMLVLRCPTWAWQAGDPAKARPFLPPGKQFLVTRNVPCQRRAVALSTGAEDEVLVSGSAGGEEEEEEWSLTHSNHVVEKQDEAPDMLSPAVAGLSLGGGGSGAGDEESHLETEGEVEAEDPSSVEDPSLLGGILKTRTYDVTITYDKYYQCGRVWLYGYSEARQPLAQKELLEDISADHALKTVTLESHPHIAEGAGLHMSIHPCKHASVMHKLVEELALSGREPRAEQYLFLFLKFISSVIPTIEYDYTVAIDGL